MRRLREESRMRHMSIRTVAPSPPPCGQCAHRRRASRRRVTRTYASDQPTVWGPLLQPSTSSSPHAPHSAVGASAGRIRRMAKQYTLDQHFKVRAVPRTLNAALLAQPYPRALQYTAAGEPRPPRMRDNSHPRFTIARHVGLPESAPPHICSERRRLCTPAAHHAQPRAAQW